ncbi:acetolactate synthase-1/2/3 large subunit [Humitalea rosea]|uniref:Acetolactate synthase-1/2/3 large subunit n=1 Tax=Humitalea rosea TaxID=990373 RepID=A0A2W7IJ71_9PROT|nr:thiamine pyrophosphate-binding protein [Humitalea rosea]PZW46979.1 acetolactate synthase-1/2/3 large subunit [Humitalea rosea]
MTEPSRTADLLARLLHRAGCRHAFGIPGGEVLTVIDALDRAGIEFLLARHETPAGFMAEGAHHMTGAPGILVTTIGPGLANAVDTIANAWQDRVPLIVVSGGVDDAEAASYTHQVIDHCALMRPITKATFRVAVPGAAPAIFAKALAIAMSAPFGPVHIDIPGSVAAAPATAPEAADPALRAPMAPAPGTVLDDMRGWLAAARRPLIIAGVDAMNDEAGPVLAAISAGHGIPVLTTYKAKGLVDEASPWSLGGAGLSPLADRRLLPLVAEADLVILAGYDPIEMRIAWRDLFAAGQHVVSLASATGTHGMHRADIECLCDIGAGLTAIFAGYDGAPAWDLDRFAEVKAALRADYGADAPWGPAAIVDAAQSALPADIVATVDSGAHRIVLSQVWQCRAPRSLLQSSGFCTMGPSLPLALGAMVAAPGRRAICFIGDGGLEMVMGELATARDLGLPVIILVFVDASYALIELKQGAMQLPRRGVRFTRTDHVALAAAMGGQGWAVRTRAELEIALGEAMVTTERFSLIACEIAAEDYIGRL